MDPLLIAILAVFAAAFLYFVAFRAPEKKVESDQSRQDKPTSDEKSSDVSASPEPSGSTESPDEEPPAPDSGDVPSALASEERPRPAPTAEGGPDLPTLRKGLARSRESGGLFGKLKALFGSEPTIDSTLAEEIEEILLSSDVGVATTQAILERLRGSLDSGELKDSSAVWRALREQAVQMLALGDGSSGLQLEHSPTVVLFVGVNGAGKTTTIGKLATRLKESGKTCVLAAGDTFRAAAVQQLVIWGKRVGCEVVHGKDGADPGSVLFDAISKAKESGADIVLADTAGRLHTKANLMNEMQKIARSAGKALDGAPHETFLVIDSTNGQNAVAQAKEFKDALDLSGIVLTKLDGTAKGGVVLGICDTLRVPVRFVGLGEGPSDLHEFYPKRFVDALLGEES